MSSFTEADNASRKPEVVSSNGHSSGIVWAARPLGRIILCVVLLDLLLGGNGYLIEIAGFRMRELLFPICLLWVGARLTVIEPVRLPKAIVAFLVLFLLTTTLAALVGYFEGSRISAIIAELKPLSYFLMLPFFVFAIRNDDDVSFVARLIIICGFVVAFIYLMILAAAYFEWIEYRSIYEFLRRKDEFIFRHNPASDIFVGFLYKGIFNVCVAIIFFLLDPHRSTKIFVILLISAVALSMTRGLVAALAVCMVIAIFLNGNWRRAPIVIAHVAFLLFILYTAIGIENRFLTASGDRPAAKGRTDSGIAVVVRPQDNIRIHDLQFILKNADAPMVLLGRGLGAPIGKRARIEMTYPELFYKQGVLGLALWGGLFLYMGWLYLKIPKSKKQYGLAFFVSGIFVYGATATNPFLTGSIGMSIVFIAIASLSVLSDRSAETKEKGRGPLWYSGKLIPVSMRSQA